MKTEIQIGDIVTAQFDSLGASNTCIVKDVGKDSALLAHPLFEEIMIARPIDSLNVAAANLKDSTERSLDFANTNKKFLDYNTIADLESLCLYFVVRRKLTPRQKFILSNICGNIASIKFNNDIKAAMAYVVKNEAVLDEFNSMWYRNFSGLFSGKQQITSKKQRAAIFNIAGFALAELEIPTTPK
jgi:hypothetical protein